MRPADRSAAGVEMRRQARAVARVEAGRVLAELLRDNDDSALATFDRAAAGLAGALAVLVAALRHDGASWAEVADPLGRTRQAAQQRFGAGRPEAFDTADELVAHYLQAAGYDSERPDRLTIGHAGHLAGYCFQRQHTRCPGHSHGEACACQCHDPAERPDHWNQLGDWE